MTLNEQELEGFEMTLHWTSEMKKARACLDSKREGAAFSLKQQETLEAMLDRIENAIQMLQDDLETP